MNAASLVYVTVADIDEARRIASSLLEESLIACANIIPAIESLYRWGGVVKQDNEVLLLMKTTNSQLGYLTERINELHSYECPCIVACALNCLHQPFHQWLCDTVLPLSGNET